MMTKLVLIALLRSVMLVNDSEISADYRNDVIAIPVRKAQIDEAIALPVRKSHPSVVALPVRKAQIDEAIALPVRKSHPSVVALPVRKKTESSRPKVVATIYSASSFRCPACESLEDFVRSSRKISYVALNKSEPAWVRAYPTVIYHDGHGPDNGQHLKSIIDRL